MAKSLDEFTHVLDYMVDDYRRIADNAWVKMVRACIYSVPQADLQLLMRNVSERKDSGRPSSYRQAERAEAVEGKQAYRPPTKKAKGRTRGSCRV